jgi:hypothetical protein
MRIRKSIAMVAIGLVAGATIATGATLAMDAGATGTSVTYFGCLKAGRITKVATVAPTCQSNSTSISWNSQGPQGPPGATGPTGPAGPGAQSGFGQPVAVPSGGESASVTLALSAGDYSVTWSIGVAMPNDGSCGESGGTNVTALSGGLSSELVSVGTEGGSLTVTCTGNSIGDALVTATPTAVQ